MSLGLGGAALRRRPIALVRSLLNVADTRELDVITWVGSVDVDLLIATGRVRRLRAAYVGFGPLGLSRSLRDAGASGSIEIHEHSEASFIAALTAGAGGLPFAVNRSLLGTSLRNPDLREIRSPFNPEERAVAVRALRPEVVFLHAGQADETGNILRPRPNMSDDIDHLFAAAGTHVFVSVEQVVSLAEARQRRDDVVIPGKLVEGVIEAPRGAHPCGCDGWYDADVKHIVNYQAASADAGALADYLDEWVFVHAHDQYREKLEHSGVDVDGV
jgi:glutaconate CoA-transferase subunit A